VAAFLVPSPCIADRLRAFRPGVKDTRHVEGENVAIRVVSLLAFWLTEMALIAFLGASARGNSENYSEDFSTVGDTAKLSSFAGKD
jgi:hypothetical protein